MPLIWILIFVISLAVLIKASDWFTDGAEKIGLSFKIPPFIIGVTIVALGTSLPELISSVIAVVQGSSEIVAGNVVGSNIANIFLVLGFAAIIGKKLNISFELIHVDLPLLLGSTFLVAAMMWDGMFTWPEGIICLLGLILYLHYTVKSDRAGEETKETKQATQKLKQQTTHPITWQYGKVIISALLIFIGAKYTIDAVIAISDILNIAKELIAISAVALGTSLPELVVSFQAARRGKAEIAVGNVLGSNIFNSFAVLGIPSFIAPLAVPATLISFAIPMMVIGALMYVVITQDKEITRWEGGLLLLFYIFFVAKIFNLL